MTAQLAAMTVREEGQVKINSPALRKTKQKTDMKLLPNAPAYF